MSLDDIDKDLHELEAIQNYDEVVNEKDTAISDSYALRKEKKSLETELTKNKDELRILRKNEKRRKRRIKELTFAVRDLKSRNKELEDLRTTTDGRSLKEAQKAFLETEKAEINRLAKSRSQEIIEDWEKNEKNREVSCTAIQYLEGIIAWSSEKQGYIRQELLNSKLPDQVKGLINKEVYRRLDAEFERRVELRSQEIAHVKLESLIKDKWPKWFNSEIEPRLSQFENLIRTNSLTALEGDYSIICNKCNTKQTITITHVEIDGLLRMGTISPECINPKCKDLWMRHRLPITMKDLIKWRLEL